MNVVIVESPSKAKTINKYLGSDYTVFASYGHIRDLPSKNGSVQPDDDFAMTWDVDAKSAKRINEIAKAVKGSDKLILATDPDREGEAISWHLLEVLKQKNALKNVDIERVVFNAVTKRAVLDAMEHPRAIDSELVDAYLARRALDYLVGFTLSPVLWRKLPGSRSAGRVQSVALRLVCDRELEIEAFTAQEYWTVAAALTSTAGDPFTGRLTIFDGNKLKKFDLNNEESARAAQKAVEQAAFTVSAVESKPTKRNPSPPFTTSTLQQEAARKLGFAASRTMMTAQRLYEGIDIGGETTGLITYMRTDGVQMAPEAIDRTREVITNEYGKDYLPESARIYKSKARNAQEAHEAIRPTDLARLPKDVTGFLDADQARLYELIWKRTVASQMESARLERTNVDMSESSGRIVLRATGTVTLFDGYWKLYEEGKDDSKDDDDAAKLPKLTQGESVSVGKVDADQHFTEPPPRYTEATLVKKLEELGIGRPSTYAQTLSVLRDRSYVRMDRNRFIPEDKGRLVTAFLESFFNRYVEYDFTADLEQKLDRVSSGELNWKEFLRTFWTEFHASVDEIAGVRNRQVLDALNEVLGPHVFPAKDDGSDPRACPSCNEGQLSLKTGKYGAFVGCSNYPECKFTRQLNAGDDENAVLANEPKVLGKDPDTELEVTLRSGRFGPFVQLGEAEDGEKPKRSGLPKGADPQTIDLEKALQLLSLPRDVGTHPESGKPIKAGIGRFGPYILHDGMYANIKDPEEIYTIGINRAVSLLAEKAARGGGRKRSAQKPLKEVGKHPEDGEPIGVYDGRYGPYVKHGKTNASLPDGLTPDAITLEQAVELIEARSKKKKPAAKKKAAAKKKTAKKTAKKKTAKKKTTASKKSTTKKTAPKTESAE